MSAYNFHHVWDAPGSKRQRRCANRSPRCHTVGHHFGGTMLLTGLRTGSWMGHRVDQRQVVDQIGVHGRFGGAGRRALFHGIVGVCLFLAAAKPTFPDEADRSFQVTCKHDATCASSTGATGIAKASFAAIPSEAESTVVSQDRSWVPTPAAYLPPNNPPRLPRMPPVPDVFPASTSSIME